MGEKIYIIVFSTHFHYYQIFNNFIFNEFKFLTRYHLLHASLSFIFVVLGKKIGSFFLNSFQLLNTFINFVFCETQIFNQSPFELFRCLP